MNKLFLVALSTLLLGGCTLTQFTGKGASDVMQQIYSPLPSASPTPESDTGLDSMPSTSASTDASSINSDLDATVILEEDFSDLE